MKAANITLSHSPDNITWTVAGNLFDLQVGEKTKVTSSDEFLDSNDGYTKAVGGIRDGGEWTFELMWTNADPAQVALNSEFEGDLNGHYRATFPDNSTLTSEGVLTSIGQPITKNETIRQTFKMKASGAPVWVFP